MGMEVVRCDARYRSIWIFATLTESESSPLRRIRPGVERSSIVTFFVPSVRSVDRGGPYTPLRCLACSARRARARCGYGVQTVGGPLRHTFLHCAIYTRLSNIHPPSTPHLRRRCDVWATCHEGEREDCREGGSCTLSRCEIAASHVQPSAIPCAGSCAEKRIVTVALSSRHVLELQLELEPSA